MQAGNQQRGSGQGGGGDGGEASEQNEQGGTDGQRPGSRLAQRLGERSRQSGRGGGGGSNLGGPEGASAGPLTGEDFTAWADRLRNVEEMVDDPQLRAEIARVREVAKGVRAEFKRHSVEPNWEMVQTKVGTPLASLRDRLSEELARRNSKENLVPIDRDPVPSKYAERVRLYYEELGRSR